MDNEGGQQPILDPLGEGAGLGDENVDQYFDDGGETFLPADHVSSTILYHSWPFKQELAV